MSTDPAPTGSSRMGRAGRWLGYRAVSAAVHHTVLLRWLAALGRRHPGLAHAAGAVASRDDVAAAFHLQTQFSSTAHRPNLVAGEFVIGLASGPEHRQQRQGLIERLPTPARFGGLAADESRSRCQHWLRQGEGSFDLVSDYMAPIVWQSLRGCFGRALPTLPDKDPLYGHLRRIGAHLIVGGVAPADVQANARQSAAALDAWLRPRLDEVQHEWQLPGSEHRDAVMRDMVGLLWVGHPATVQALALIVLELLPGKVWAELAEAVQRLHGDSAKISTGNGGGSDKASVWHDAALRARLAGHVLEALRFRPPFPILSRHVVRDTHVGTQTVSSIRGGRTLTLLAIGALFDPKAHAEPTSAASYCPARQWLQPEDRYLMFGHGARHCVARDQVVEALVSGLIGLLLLPRLRFARPWWRRFELEGPAIARLELRFGKP